jgi:hypothetical protein
MRTLVSSLALLVFVALVGASSARADNTYGKVCFANLQPGGSAGGVLFVLEKTGNCTGGSPVWLQICGPSRIDSSCSTSVRWQAAELIAVYQALLGAIDFGRLVEVQYPSGVTGNKPATNIVFRPGN